MLISRFAFSLTCLLAAALASAAELLKPLTIVLVGDSTVATYAGKDKDKADQAGWGQVFGEFFHDVTVKNHAKGGEATKSFLNPERGRWKAALADKPDYVFIQFGHNDQPGKGENRETDPATTYPANLRQFIANARAIGAQPVLVTSMARRTWSRTEPGRIDSSLTPYVEAVKKVAAEQNVPLIDLHSPSIVLYEKLGPEKAKSLGPNEKDGTHFSTAGARTIARLIIDQLPAAVPALKPYLK